MARNNRRQTLSAILGAAALAAASTVLAPAAAWAFPDRPITLIVPWAAGGSTDQTARALSAAAERILGQPVVILNRGGASTTIGMTELAAAEPDGYTIGTLSSSTYLAPLTGLDVSYDMMESFDFVSYYGDNLIAIAVRADSPYQSIEDLLEAGRANPGRITYGTAGPNTTQNLMTTLMMESSGVQFTMVPYRGSAEAMPALLGGQVDFITEVSVWAPFVESGEVRLLALNQPDRVAAYPDVATLDAALGAGDHRAGRPAGGCARNAGGCLHGGRRG